MSTACMQHAEPADGTQLCFDLHDGKFGPWLITHKGDPAVRKLFDDHYSRHSKGHSQFCRPGNNLILRKADCTAAWIFVRLPPFERSITGYGQHWTLVNLLMPMTFSGMGTITISFSIICRKWCSMEGYPLGAAWKKA